MNINLLIALGLFILGQSLIWFQNNLQFISEWAKRHPIILAIVFGSTVSYVFIKATYYAYIGLDNQLWPGRLIGTAAGYAVFSLLTWYLLGESINMKTIVCMVLALAIVLIQVFWK
jgi:hypothetical protein